MDTPDKAISIRDISRLSGVSIATVSRIINNNGRYSKETERRVLEIIEKHHYAPNLTARRLRTREQNFVAIIVPDITNEFFACICQKLQEKLLEAGYLALLCNTAEDMETQRQYLNMLGIVNLAGIIFVAGSTKTEDLSARAIPTIYIDRTPHEDAMAHSLVVESDNYGGAVMAVRELYEKGCRRIAFIRSTKDISTHSVRQKGFEEELARCGLEIDPKLMLGVDEVSFEAARIKMMELLQNDTDFDGIFCCTDWLASGALAALEEYGMDVPSQVKVIGFDDISIARLAAKPMTTIHQNIDEISKTAVEELIRSIRSGHVEARCYKIDVFLVKRSTT